MGQRSAAGPDDYAAGSPSPKARPESDDSAAGSSSDEVGPDLEEGGHGSVAGGEGGPAASLVGLRVIDLSQNLAGPLATRILADLGADVIKVEPTGGDPARGWGPPFWGNDATLFHCVNRNKRSVVLELKTEAGRVSLEGLVAGADVFVQAFRPGVIERLGFGVDRLRSEYPVLIYGSVLGFGSDGPLKDRPGYDPLMQAYSGMMSVTGEAGGSPVRSGVSVIDFATGSWLAVAILAALRSRDATGEGSYVTTALFDTAISAMSYHLLGTLATGQIPGPSGTGFAAIAPYGAFSCSDGSIMIAAANNAIFSRLCVALMVPGIADDPRFQSNATRVENRPELFAIIHAATELLTTQEAEKRLVAQNVPCARIRDVGEVLDCPQLAASGMIQPAGRADAEELVDFALPIAFDGQRPGLYRPPPHLGEHTTEVLAESP